MTKTVKFLWDIQNDHTYLLFPRYTVEDFFISTQATDIAYKNLVDGLNTKYVIGWNSKN